MSTIIKTKVEDFASRLKSACETNEPAEIARLLEISYQTAKNYLDGRLPAAEVLITIAVKTGISLNWLLTGEGAAFGAETGYKPPRESKPLEEKWAIRIEDLELSLAGPSGKIVSPDAEFVVDVNDALQRLAQTMRQTSGEND